MASPILVTKLYFPAPRPNLVPRPDLIKCLDQGLNCKLTLISAPAGFGKTTLVTEWLQQHIRDDASPLSHVAWFSLDEGDNDLVRFLTYFTEALNRLPGRDSQVGDGVLSMLQSPQPPPAATILITLINEIAVIPSKIALVLDDYHLIEALPVHEAINFLIENQPPNFHLVIATREDPPLSLSRLRVRDQMTELRAADLRFTSTEAADFLNHVMGLNLSPDDIAELETRTEGWIAGLQLAAISMRGKGDASKFIKSFSGSHRLVLDYLIEEVLNQQPENIQAFLLKTSILDRFTGSSCDSLTGQDNGQETLEVLERANLFIVSLDEERRWYRYHHLFTELLQQRLRQTDQDQIPLLHRKASEWYEENGYGLEAFQHAAAANDVERAERLIEGEGGLSLTFRGAVMPVLNWLRSLETAVLDATPSLWVTYAMTLLTTGEIAGVEEKLQAAEAAIQETELDDKTRDLIGRIADTRGTMAVAQHQTENLIRQSRRALEYLHSDNLTYRTATTWKLGFAYELQGDRMAAKKAYTEAISISQASGNVYTHILATVGLGNMQMADNLLHLAAETYRYALQLVGDRPIPVACRVNLSLARIFYEWNNLDDAQEYGQLSLKQGRSFSDFSDIYLEAQLFLASLKLTLGDVIGADTLISEVKQSIRQHNFTRLIPDLEAVQIRSLIAQGKLKAANDLVETHQHPINGARVHLAQDNPTHALAALEPMRQQAEAMNWQDDQLKVMVLQSVAYNTAGEHERALQVLENALATAEPNRFIRIFVDEGSPMASLLYEALQREIHPAYVQRLLAAFPVSEAEQTPDRIQVDDSEWIEPLSKREIEVLQLIAKGLTNQEIATQLVLSLHTVKTHTRNIYGKLAINSRTQAVEKARTLGILPLT